MKSARIFSFAARFVAPLAFVFLACAPAVLSGQTATPPVNAMDFGSSAVGTAAAQTAVTFTVVSGGTMGTPLVLTQGTPNLDFTLGTASTCTGAVGSGTCIVNVIFKPRAPGQRMGAVELTNSSGKVVATAFVYAMGTGPSAMLAPGTIRTIAGGATLQTCPKTTDPCGDGGAVSAAQFGEHGDVTVDAAGNLYIADRDLYRIRKVDVLTGNITTIAGTGNVCNSAGSACGDGGPATSAMLGYPGRVAVDGAGNVFIPDESASSIRKVDAITGVISNFASGFAGLFNGPNYVTIDAVGNLFACDRSRVYKVAAGTRTISAVAGPAGGYTGFNGDGQAATSAQLQPGGVAVDAAGNLYVADIQNNRIRKVTASTGLISTIAGSGAQGYDPTQNGGPATSAALYNPRGMALDAAGDVYFSDTFNNVVRKVTAAGIITTVAGNGQQGFDIDTGTATAVKLYFPSGVALDSAGNLLIHDDDNFRIRRVSASPAALAFASTNVGTVSSDSPRTVTVGNSGNAPLTFAPPASGVNPSITAGYTLASSSTCPQVSLTGNPGVLAAGSSCTADVVFKPTAASQTNSGSLIFTDDSLNVAGSTQSVALSGISTGTTGIVTPNLALTVPTTTAPGATVGGTLQFSSSSTSSPTGNVTIYAVASGSTTPIALNTVVSSTATGGNGAAFSFTAPTAPGTYSVYASYSGDANFNSASSPNSTLTVVSAAKGTVTLSVYAPAGEVSGTAITGTISAVFAGNAATPTGSVVVTAVPTSGNPNPSVVLGTFPAATLATAGAPGVSLPYTAPAAGFYNVTATYVGDTNFNAATPVFATINVSPAATPTTSSLSAPSISPAGIPFNVTVSLIPRAASTATITGNVVITATPSGGSVLTLATIPASQAAVAGGTVVPVKLRLGGSYVLTTSYSGDPLYAASTASIGVTATGGTGTILLSGPANGTTNAPVTFTVAITNAIGSSGVPIVLSSTLSGATGPTANVFYDAAFTGTSAQLLFSSPGTYVVTANFPGDAVNPSASSSPLTIVIVPTTTPAFSFSADDPNVLDANAAPLYLQDPAGTVSTGLTLTAVAGFNTQVLLTYSSTDLNTNLPFDSRLHVALKDASGKVITATTPLASGTKITLVISGQAIAALDRPNLQNLQLPLYLAGGLLCVGLAGNRKHSLAVTRALRFLGIVLVVALSSTLLSACNANNCFNSDSNDTFGTVNLIATPANATQGASPQILKVAVQLSSYYVN